MKVKNGNAAVAGLPSASRNADCGCSYYRGLWELNKSEGRGCVFVADVQSTAGPRRVIRSAEEWKDASRISQYQDSGTFAQISMNILWARTGRFFCSSCLNGREPR